MAFVTHGVCGQSAEALFKDYSIDGRNTCSTHSWKSENGVMKPEQKDVNRLKLSR